eukprot:2845752-Rhodomonas_salina.1
MMSVCVDHRWAFWISCRWIVTHCTSVHGIREQLPKWLASKKNLSKCTAAPGPSGPSTDSDAPNQPEPHIQADTWRAVRIPSFKLICSVAEGVPLRSVLVCIAAASESLRPRLTLELKPSHWDQLGFCPDILCSVPSSEAFRVRPPGSLCQRQGIAQASPRPPDHCR